MDAKLLELLSSGFRDAYDALQHAPERRQRHGSFVSAASGVTTVTIKNPLASKPSHVSLNLRREDFADFSAAWSWWFVVTGESISLKFVSLPASTRCVYSLDFS